MQSHDSEMLLRSQECWQQITDHWLQQGVDKWGILRVTFQYNGVDGNPISLSCRESGRRGDRDRKYGSVLNL